MRKYSGPSTLMLRHKSIITRLRHLANDTYMYNIVNKTFLVSTNIIDPLYQSNMSTSSQDSEFNEQQLNDLEQL